MKMPSSYKRIIKVRKPIKQVVRIPVEAEGDEPVIPAENTAPVDAPPQTDAPEPPQEDLLQISQSEFQQELDFAYKRGLEEGKLEGFRAAEAELGQAVQMAQSVVEALQQQQETFFQTNEQFVLQVIFKIAERIVGPLAEQQEALIRETLNKILHEAQVSGRIKILVHPEDLNTLQSIEPELRKNFPDLKEIGFVADETITRGGCLVETDLGKLDARIETQVNELVKQLRKLAAAL